MNFDEMAHELEQMSERVTEIGVRL